MGSVEDRLAIEELLSIYGYIVDDERWEDLGEVYTEDATFTFEARGYVLRGLDEICEGYRRMSHPAAHHDTNPVVTFDAARGAAGGLPRAAARSRFLTVGNDGLCTSGEYADTLVRGPGGWRIGERTVTVRALRPSAPGARGG